MPAIKKRLFKLKNGKTSISQNDILWDEFIKEGSYTEPQIAKYQRGRCCIISHTGGTTGVPKGVMLSDDNINAVVSEYKYLGIPFKRQQKYFDDLPPFIIYGLCIATHMTLCYGQEVILYPVFDSKKFPKQFRKYKPQHFSALAEHLYYLLKDKATRNMNLSFLITPAIGGDTLNAKTEQELNDHLKTHNCRFEVIKGYGMTELSSTACTMFAGANAIGSVGVPLVKNTIKVVGADGKELTYNKTGEICISGPSIMIGYHNKTKETNEIIKTDPDGTRWVHTGDLGHISEDGLLFHEGRIRRIYLTFEGGQPAKIFPIQVENAIMNSTQIEECTVVGRKMKESAYYEVVAFAVEKDKSVDENELIKELRTLCKKMLPSYMWPVEYRFVDDLPHTMAGKIDYRKLEELAKA